MLLCCQQARDILHGQYISNFKIYYKRTKMIYFITVVSCFVHFIFCRRFYGPVLLNALHYTHLSSNIFFALNKLDFSEKYKKSCNYLLPLSLRFGRNATVSFSCHGYGLYLFPPFRSSNHPILPPSLQVASASCHGVSARLTLKLTLTSVL